MTVETHIAVFHFGGGGHRDICMSPGQPGEGEGPEHLKVQQQRGEDPTGRGTERRGERRRRIKRQRGGKREKHTARSLMETEDELGGILWNSVEFLICCGLVSRTRHPLSFNAPHTRCPTSQPPPKKTTRAGLFYCITFLIRYTITTKIEIERARCTRGIWNEISPSAANLFSCT